MEQPGFTELLVESVKAEEDGDLGVAINLRGQAVEVADPNTPQLGMGLVGLGHLIIKRASTKDNAIEMAKLGAQYLESGIDRLKDHHYERFSSVVESARRRVQLVGAACSHSQAFMLLIRNFMDPEMRSAAAAAAFGSRKRGQALIRLAAA